MSLRTKLENGKKVFREQTENLRRLESDYESLEKNFYREKHELAETILHKDEEISVLKVIQGKKIKRIFEKNNYKQNDLSNSLLEAEKFQLESGNVEKKAVLGLEDRLRTTEARLEAEQINKRNVETTLNEK